MLNFLSFHIGLAFSIISAATLFDEKEKVLGGIASTFLILDRLTKVNDQNLQIFI